MLSHHFPKQDVPKPAGISWLPVGRYANADAFFVSLLRGLAGLALTIGLGMTDPLPLPCGQYPDASKSGAYFFTQKSPGRMKPSPRIGFSSQPPVVGM
jgi:hypothetical protein